jgi:hypothetical protein
MQASFISVPRGTALVWRIRPSTGLEEVFCTRCRTWKMRTVREPVDRRRHTKTAHRVRTVDYCSKCDDWLVLNYGG